jgi:hypothetical protein
MSNVIKAPTYSEVMFAVRIPGYEFEKNAKFEVSNCDYLVVQERIPLSPVYSSYNNEKYLNKKCIPELQCKLFSKKVNCAIFAIEREVKISSYAFEDIYCTTLQSKSDTDKAVINIIVESFISLSDQNKFFKNFIFNNDFQCYTYKKLYNIYKEFANEAIKRVVKNLDLPVRTYNLNKEFGKGLDAEETKLFNEIKKGIEHQFALVGLKVDFKMRDKRSY